MREDGRMRLERIKISRLECRTRMDKKIGED